VPIADIVDPDDEGFSNPPQQPSLAYEPFPYFRVERVPLVKHLDRHLRVKLSSRARTTTAKAPIPTTGPRT
jgi:hypothetical protein